MKRKTSELEGAALNWAVAKCENTRLGFTADVIGGVNYTPSTDWAQGGPIIEREGLDVQFDRDWVYDPTNVDPDDEPDNGDRWFATYALGNDRTCCEYGPTPLVAAMRCYVASRLGHEVDIPKELA